MKLSMKHLTNTFKRARETSSPFVFIAIMAEGTEEIVTIPAKSFDAKENFYNKAYTEDLVHVMNKEVYIRGLSYGVATDLNNIA